MRLQTIVNSNHSLQVTYLDEADIDEETGIMEARTIDIPHEVLPQEVMDELLDVTRQLLEIVRVARRRPAERFVAPR